MNEHHVAAPVRDRLSAVTSGYDHLVGFYDTEEFLTSSVVQFLTPALEDGEAALIIATPEHTRRFGDALSVAGLDVEAARRSGQLVSLDATEVIAGLYVRGRPDADRLPELLAPTITAAGRSGRPVRIVGELCPLLWQADEISLASALEEFGDRLASTGPHTMLCMYPTNVVDSQDRTLAFLTVCEQHTGVIPSETYSTLPDLDGRLRRIALLQQESLAARAERRELQQTQTELRESLADLQERDRYRDEVLGRFIEQLEDPTFASLVELAELRDTGRDHVPRDAIAILHHHLTRLQELLEEHLAAWHIPTYHDHDPAPGRHEPGERP